MSDMGNVYKWSEDKLQRVNTIAIRLSLITLAQEKLVAATDFVGSDLYTSLHREEHELLNKLRELINE